MEKPNPKVPQLWLQENVFDLHSRRSTLRVLYPNGFVEAYLFGEWDVSFLSGNSHDEATALLKEYSHEFISNIE